VLHTRCTPIVSYIIRCPPRPASLLSPWVGSGAILAPTGRGFSSLSGSILHYPSAPAHACTAVPDMAHRSAPCAIDYRYPATLPVTGGLLPVTGAANHQLPVFHQSGKGNPLITWRCAYPAAVPAMQRTTTRRTQWLETDPAKAGHAASPSSRVFSHSLKEDTGGSTREEGNAAKPRFQVCSQHKHDAAARNLIAGPQVCRPDAHHKL
jgi:hypothetical protein